MFLNFSPILPLQFHSYVDLYVKDKLNTHREDRTRSHIEPRFILFECVPNRFHSCVYVYKRNTHTAPKTQNSFTLRAQFYYYCLVP